MVTLTRQHKQPKHCFTVVVNYGVMEHKASDGPEISGKTAG